MSVNGLLSLWINKYQQYSELLNLKTLNSKPVHTILGSIFQSCFPTSTLIPSKPIVRDKTGQHLTVCATRPILTKSRRFFTYWRVNYLSEIQMYVFVLTFFKQQRYLLMIVALGGFLSLKLRVQKSSCFAIIQSPIYSTQNTILYHEKIKQKSPYQPQDSLDICHLLFNHVGHKLIVTYTEISSAVSWLRIYHYWHQKRKSYGPHNSCLHTPLTPNAPHKELMGPSVPSIPASYWSPAVIRKSCSILWLGNAKPLTTPWITDSLLLCPHSAAPVLQQPSC